MATLKSKLRLLPVIFAAIVILSSCIEENFKGYPKNIYFSHEGGNLTISGNDFFRGIGIREGEKLVIDGFVDYENDSTVVAYQWLTIIAKSGENKIKIVAEPTDISKKRKLIIFGDFGSEYCEIKVVQAGR